MVWVGGRARAASKGGGRGASSGTAHGVRASRRELWLFVRHVRPAAGCLVGCRSLSLLTHVKCVSFGRAPHMFRCGCGCVCVPMLCCPPSCPWER